MATKKEEGGRREGVEGVEEEEEDEEEEEEEEDTIELTAHCLCRAHIFTAAVPRSALPLSATYCHCTSCRRVTGALYSTYIPWPGDGAAAIRASTLRRYDFAAGSIATLFCGVCSTAVFAETLPADGDGLPNYGAQTGVLVNADVPAAGPGLVKIAHHVFAGDTLDGGAIPWLCDVNGDGSRPRLWKTDRAGEELSSSLTSLAHENWPANTETTGATAAAAAAAAVGEEDIPIRCHCGGVDLVLRRPNAEFAAMARSELPWFVDPVTNKSLGGFDACDACRLSSGSDVFHWTFVLLRHLAFPAPSSSSNDHDRDHGKVQPTGFPASSTELRKAVERRTSSKEEQEEQEEDRDPRWGTLTFYESSPDVQRYFCSRCSACVFYAADDRPEMVDLAIGLLEAKHGARAESVVSWDFGGKMVWRQDVVGGWREGFVESIEAAAERWRIERDYPKNWRRIQKEAQAHK